MEPRKKELNKTPEQRNEVTKSRFQIVKLEERIAPCNGVADRCQHRSPHGGR